MNHLTFFTPIHYSHPEKFSETLLETVDNYFYLGGKKATVVSKDSAGNEKVLVSEFSDKSNTLTKFLKFFSYCTLIIPAAFLLVKGCLRAQHHFKIFNTQTELEKGIEIDDLTYKKINSLMSKIMFNMDDSNLIWISKDKDKPTAIFKLHENSDLEFVVPKYGYQNTAIFDFTKNVNGLYSRIVKDAEEQLLQGKSLEKIDKTRKIIVSNPLFTQCKESLLVRKIHGS